MVESNNRTVYGIQSDAERYFWISYLTTVVISSIIGDVVILVASTKYNVFKLNDFIIVLIQHIAVCDLTMSLGYIIPTIVALVEERWVLGDFIAYTQEFFAFSLFPVSNILVCALTSSKYVLMKYRLQTRGWTRKKAHIACGVLWLSCATFSMSLLFINKEIVFDYTSYDVDYVRSNNSVWKYAGLSVGLLYCIPIIIVIISSVLTLQYLVEARKISRRGGGLLRWQGILAVLLTGIVYCVSSLPYTVYKMRRPFVPPFETPPESPPGYFHIQFKRHSEYMTLLNVMSNFYIYSLTVRSFRRSIWSKIATKVPLSGQRKESTPDAIAPGIGENRGGTQLIEDNNLEDCAAIQFDTIFMKDSEI